MDRLPDVDGDRGCSTRTPEGGEKHVNRLLDTLGNYRQRCVLYQFTDDTSASFEEIVDRVVAMETGQPPADVPAEIRDRVKADLYHQTLPKLADLDVVEYDSVTGTIRYEPPSHIEKFLALSRELDPV